MAESPVEANPPLLVFADDWGRHPSSCQHLIKQLLPQHQVIWVNTIGTRRPRFDLYTLARGAAKMRGWIKKSIKPATDAENLRVVQPLMWPWLTASRDRRLNRAMLSRTLLPILHSLPQPPIAITTLPIVADLIPSLPVARWVYYCVDDFTQWPGLDHMSLDEMERSLVQRADVLIAVSETLQRRLGELGRSAELLTHGVDLDHWRNPNPTSLEPATLALERPWIVFWGVVDPRLDSGVVRHLASQLTQGTVLLAGPQADADQSLFELPRVRHLPALPYDQLPALAREARVLIMPYADLPVTRAMQPLKLKEYLATGKPTVVSDLPAVRPWADCLDIARTSAEFTSAVFARLDSGLPESQRLARARLQGESWQAKAQQFCRAAMRHPEERGTTIAVQATRC